MSNYMVRVDLPFYRQQVEQFLPDQVIDFHTHIYRSEQFTALPAPARNWAEYVSPRTWSVDTLIRYYQRLLPGKTVTPVVFAMPLNEPDFDLANRYTRESAERFEAFPFLLTRPEWTEAELEQRVREGGFRGLKPYPTMAHGKSENDISVFDYLPHHHLAVAEALAICIILHLPRAGRLADPSNVAELHEIAERYPRLKLVVAHIGRAYCLPTAEKGLAQLRDCPGLLYDISASANADVFELALREVGAKRLIFGTDLPAVAFRARRICEGDNYVNIVRHSGFTGSHLRVAVPEERDTVTFYIYEQIAAFRVAAERVGLGQQDIEDVFRNNAERLLHG
ncbi:MAG: amidohydrolase family protein [Anaerolineae bacterium]